MGNTISPAEAAAAGHDNELLSTQGITPTTVERLREAAARDLAPALNAMAKCNIRLLLMSDAEYPTALRSIPDPPPYLFARGTIEAQDEVGVAIVGTRHTTEYGRGVAAKLATDLAVRGVTVVSGLARGVDTAAHRGALEAGGRTFAVCGCGLDITYPSENRPLMERIAGNGAALSEFAPTVHPKRGTFRRATASLAG
jgi:DNA processing protein